MHWIGTPILSCLKKLALAEFRRCSRRELLAIQIWDRISFFGLMKSESDENMTILNARSEFSNSFKVPNSLFEKDMPIDKKSRTVASIFTGPNRIGDSAGLMHPDRNSDRPFIKKNSAVFNDIILDNEKQ